jgi:hypothetical protein
MKRRTFIKVLAALPFLGWASKNSTAKIVSNQVEENIPGSCCPVCGNPDVDLSRLAMLFSHCLINLNGGKFSCNSCGAQGELRVKRIKKVLDSNWEKISQTMKRKL